ncbi:MAG: bilirubin oxidase [Fimbriimonadales bacterium]|nr:MAG: bilirubin oxidase [Fimbriimonadales bacterium]
MNNELSRRDLLRKLGFAAAGSLLGGATTASQLLGGHKQTELGSGRAQDRAPYLQIALEAGPGQVQIRSGPPTNVLRFTGSVQRGRQDALLPSPGSYLGPTLSLWQGEPVTIFFSNNLQEESIVHWHGMYVPHYADGHPMDVIGPGSMYAYHYRVWNRAGTYWYHPHPHMMTGPQVYAGLAGGLIVHDLEEQALDLPSGEFDRLLVLQDRVLDSQNQFVYLPNPMRGTLGSEILVNGQPNYTMNVKTRAYRLRILNGSNARIYKLAWGDGSPMTVIGTDGGLVEYPLEKPYVVLSPGERVEIWADFRNRTIGEQIVLKSLSMSGLMFGVGQGNDPLPNGAPFDVMRFQVTQSEKEYRDLPKRLSTIQWHREEDAVNRKDPRYLTARWDSNMGWVLNDEMYDMHGTKPNERVRANTLEVWEIENLGGNITMAHPIHLHGQQFMVLSREIHPMYQLGWETVRYGYTDEGWKDTVLLMPGEKIRFLVRFGQYTGLFLYHCHNLEHEDMGMMRNYLVY